MSIKSISNNIPLKLYFFLKQKNGIKINQKCDSKEKAKNIGKKIKITQLSHIEAIKGIRNLTTLLKNIRRLLLKIIKLDHYVNKEKLQV